MTDADILSALKQNWKTFALDVASTNKITEICANIGTSLATLRSDKSSTPDVIDAARKIEAELIKLKSKKLTNEELVRSTYIIGMEAVRIKAAQRKGKGLSGAVITAANNIIKQISRTTTEQGTKVPAIITATPEAVLAFYNYWSAMVNTANPSAVLVAGPNMAAALCQLVDPHHDYSKFKSEMATLGKWTTGGAALGGGVGFLLGGPIGAFIGGTLGGVYATAPGVYYAYT